MSATRRAGKQTRDRVRRYRATEYDSARSRHSFATQHGLTCFKCGQPPSLGQIAKTGFSNRGPWMICTHCISTKTSQSSSSG